MLKILTVEQMRELDSLTIKSQAVSGYTLMERAGRGLASLVQKKASLLKKSPRILMIAGKGNNGGDTFACSRFLSRSKIPHAILVFASKDSLRGDSLLHLKKIPRIQKRLISYTCDIKTVKDLFSRFSPDIIVDGLLGTGFRGPLEKDFKQLIKLINSSKAYVISADIPSGMNGDTGKCACVKADATAVMGLPKPGLYSSQEGQRRSGYIFPVDLGFPESFISRFDSQYFLVEGKDIKSFFPRKDVTSHKGDFGRALIISGSCRYPGALILCCGAAIYANCGIVTAYTRSCNQNSIVKIYPEVTYEVINCNQSLFNKLRTLELKLYSSFVFGPGIDRKNDKDHLKCLSFLLKNLNKEQSLIIDADGLNILSLNPKLLLNSKAHIILTPHVKEFTRISGLSASSILTNRFKAVYDFSQRYGCFTVLKGFSTLTAAPEGRVFVNPTGNPGMATAGSGDVLAGILAGLCSHKGKDILGAILASVYIHGLAGDILRDSKGSYGLRASDLLPGIPTAIKTLTGY